MTQLFDETRHYLTTSEKIIALLGSKEKQAQMRHFGRSPAYYKLGRKIIYKGSDLNKWAEDRRVEAST